MYFYQRLRDLREDKDMTQEQTARILGITRQQYQLYECGRREMPFNMVIAFADFFNVSIDYIAGRTNDKLGLSRSQLPAEETELLKMYQSLDERSRGRAYGYVTALSGETGAVRKQGR